jgi:hypothetical protein
MAQLGSFHQVSYLDFETPGGFFRPAFYFVSEKDTACQKDRRDSAICVKVCSISGKNTRRFHDECIFFLLAWMLQMGSHYERQIL